jgi:hypothetical protein
MPPGYKLTIEEVKKRLFEIHGDILTLDESTYKTVMIKCRFIDKDYGDWWAVPNNVFCLKQSHPARTKEKRRQTNLRKFGHEYASQNKNIQEKRKQTCLEKYGCEYFFQNQQIKERIKQTMIEKYGVEYPYQNPDIAQKMARSQHTSTVLQHWKTKEEIVCVGGYEPKVVQHFNDKQIDFVWQICFDMPSGKKYFVDCYLPEQDLYIEIKGYMRPHSKLKWDWFHSTHPNSELWDKKKLKELKIL